MTHGIQRYWLDFIVWDTKRPWLRPFHIQINLKGYKVWIDALLGIVFWIFFRQPKCCKEEPHGCSFWKSALNGNQYSIGKVIIVQRWTELGIISHSQLRFLSYKIFWKTDNKCWRLYIVVRAAALLQLYYHHKELVQANGDDAIRADYQQLYLQWRKRKVLPSIVFTVNYKRLVKARRKTSLSSRRMFGNAEYTFSLFSI